MNWKAQVSSNFNCLFETEGRLKVTGSRLHCKCGSMFEVVQDAVFVIIDH